MLFSVVKYIFPDLNIWAIYVAEKKFADLAVLKFADAHPEVDVTICGLLSMWNY